MRFHIGWGRGGKMAPDHRVMEGGAKGNAARAQKIRKAKVPLSLPPTWGKEPAPPPAPPAPIPPPPRRRPRGKYA